MPCGNLDHEHPSWPQQGAHEFVIEACENHCGWCGYRTKMANNLRVHARRHLTNENETRLRRIKIVKGKAGRKKVQMAKRRFPGSEGCNETSDRSPSVENLNNGMNPGQTGNDWEENRRRENPREAPYPPPSAFTPHIQIPTRLHLDQDQSNSLNYPSRTQNHQSQLPLPIASMDVPSSSETNRPQSQKEIPNENETGDVESSGLSLCAKRCIENLILRPLVDSKYAPSYYLEQIVVRLEIICLRDLETDLLRVPYNQSWNSTAKKLAFSLFIIRCIKNTVPFLENCELVRPTDQPYSEKYFNEVEASLKARYQLPEVARDKESGFNREVSCSNGTLHGADKRVGSIATIPDHRLEERSEPQERDINENVLGIEEGHSWTPSNLRSIQEAAHLPGDSTQNGISQHPNPSLQGPVRSSLKELGYSEAELHGIFEHFGGCIFAPADRQLLFIAFPALSQAQNDRSEFQIAPIEEIRARAHKLSRCALKLSSNALKLNSSALKTIHKQVLLPLLRRPSLQEFKPLLLEFAVYMPGLENLRDVEGELFLYAGIRADSAIPYLRFCNYLLRCIKILIRDEASLSNEEKTSHDQSTYCEGYFTELSKTIHKVANRTWGLYEWPASKTWSCPESLCFFRHGSTSKSYLMVHLQEYHNEDVGCTGEEDLAGRSLDPLRWRCQHCFFQNFVHISGYLCWYCKVPCEEFRVKARAKSSSQENVIGKIQQDSPPAHASTIASSQSIEQGQSSSLDTPMQSASQTLQPHLSLPEPVTTPQDASNAPLELPVTTAAIKPISSEWRYRDEVVGSSQPSGSYATTSPSFCTRLSCHLEFSNFTEYQLHLDRYHKEGGFRENPRRRNNLSVPNIPRT